MRPINYSTDNTQVMAYHTIVNEDQSTTEHTAMVSLGQIPNSKRFDGTTDPNTLLMTCPICGARAWIPLLGGEESQRFHAMVRVAKGQQPVYNTAATQSVINDVIALGGIPRITPDDNPHASNGNQS